MGAMGGAEGDGGTTAKPWCAAAPDPDAPYGPYAAAPDGAAGAEDRIFEGEL
jgi:hypothetical protein